MKFIRNGLVWDTDTATRLIGEGWGIYRSPGGKYFEVHPNNLAQPIRILTEAQAKEEVGRYGTYEEYVKAFGAPLEA